MHLWSLLFGLFILWLTFAKVQDSLKTGSTRTEWVGAKRLNYTRTDNPRTYWFIVVSTIVTGCGIGLYSLWFGLFGLL